ncbi:MAG TPA: hypothetical protein VJK04_00400 [Candidatus Paceibacterota bacterium]
MQEGFMQFDVVTSTGNIVESIVRVTNSIHVHVIVSDMELKHILGPGICYDWKHRQEELADYIRKEGRLTCSVIFSPQDDQNPKDTHDHLVVEFILSLPKRVSPVSPQ